MERYRNQNGNSGVTFFKILPDAIVVQFKNQSTYLYNTMMPGSDHVENMKQLARSGKGLATYISKYVRDKYAEQLK